MNNRILALVLAGFVFSGITSTEVLADAIDDCFKKAVTSADLNHCGSLMYDRADKKLNTTYQSLMKVLDKEGQRKLINAEKAWIQYRDKYCEFDADTARGGTMSTQLVLGCLTGLTEEQTEKLQSRLEFEKKTN